MEPAQVAILVIVFFAYAVETAIGFGSAVLAVTFGAQLVPLDVLLPFLAPLSLSNSTYLAVRHRRHTRWRELLVRVLPLVAVGVPLGLVLFHLRASGWLRVAFGAFVALIAALQLRLARRPGALEQPLGKVAAGGMLALGGLVHGMFNTGGPLIVYVLGREIHDKHAFRSTLATLFVLLTIALLVDYTVAGLLNADTLRFSLLGALPMIAGIAAGEAVHARLEGPRFKTAVWAVLLAGGVILAIRAALQM
jgi:uncharacterized membrane protein YfcA